MTDDLISLSERLEVAMKLAREAGALLARNFDREKRIQHKGRIDLLTEYDLRSERLIVEGLRHHFAGDSILAEEEGRLGDSVRHWLVDPIDGTTNFAHGLPCFTVCIAFVDGLTPLLGVTYDPLRDEMFSALRGAGAWLNGHDLSVSKTEELADSLLTTGFPYDLANGPDNFGRWERLYHHSLGIRHLGCASLNPAYVAAGRLDAYWELHARPWDLAVGILLVEEAGGTVSRADGTRGVLREPCSVLASNGRLHEKMLEMLTRPAREIQRPQ